MRAITKNKIKSIAALVLVLSLFGVTSARNSSRPIKALNIKVLEDDRLLITHELIGDIVARKIGNFQKNQKGSVHLGDLESTLKANPMVLNAQVSLTVDGSLNIMVNQREPIARVLGSSSNYYIDKQGLAMPLSKVFSSRVPVITGTSGSKDIQEVYPMIRDLQDDEFLKRLVVGIHFKNDKYYLEMRSSNTEVVFGDLEDYKHKLFNLKVFYQKATRDNILKLYSQVNLEFINQVVCTKR